MFTSEDLQNLMALRENERQKLIERAKERPVWLTSIQFGNATAFRLEAGSRIMGAKVAFYGYLSLAEFYGQPEKHLRQALAAMGEVHIRNHRGKGEIIAFLDDSSVAAYERYCRDRELILVSLVIEKLGAIYASR